MVTRAGDVALGTKVWVVLWFIVGIVQAQNICNQQEKCDACIQTPDCMWCSSPKNISQYHCQNTTMDESSFCDPENLENPKNTKTVTVNIPLTNVDKEKTGLSQTEQIVQLSPQGMKLKLRKGVPENITLKYRQAMDYPVDLYYLMDLSHSMNDDKDNIAELGGRLTNRLRDITSQFTIGFGSFVDKVMMPYAYTSPKKYDEPCKDCARAYAFKNNLPLSNNGSIFAQRVKDTPISGNLDAPEGGFDALMQAMVCKEEIGWRNQSRRIIVFSTDDKFHYAGDGRLAGVVTPNDEKCHLNTKGEYDAYDKYDYPSIEQINKVSKEQNINIIFAVSGHEDLYKEVSNLIETSSFGLMKNDSSNVIDLLVKQYEEITSEVRLTDNSTNSNISIRYSSSCLDNTSPVSTKTCSGMSQGADVTFHLEIEATECPKDQDKVIVEVKTLEDSLFLEIEFDCNCNCKTEGRTENASMCSYQGALVCGICECSDGFQGDKCLCSSKDTTDGKSEDEMPCKAPGDDKVCSGKGSCSCGECACRAKEFTGKYCECNSRNCLSGSESELCSGRGSCDCDKCNCEESGYTGRFCQCPPDNVCIKEGSLDVCSGHGSCDCGKCICNETYSGKYCDDCPTCASEKCLEFRGQYCVQCQFDTPPCKCDLTATLVPSLTLHIDDGAQECTYQDEVDGCYFSFSYKYIDGDKGYDIQIRNYKECAEQTELLGIVLGLVGVIVAIGILTLCIWKAVTTVHDRKEYAKFDDERKKAAWNTEDNPLYKDPSQTIQNPVFSRST